MTAGFQADPIKEHAAMIELAAAINTWQDAEQDVRAMATEAIQSGCRSQVVAGQLGMSRATLHRWLHPSE